MEPSIYPKAWFLTTSYGSNWTDSTLTQNVYEEALVVAALDHRVIDVQNNCPQLFPIALSLYIAIILVQGGSGGSGASVIDPAASDKVAYVTADKVYDTQRNYTLVDTTKETSGALPSNLLAKMFEQCKPIVTGMRVVRGRLGCGGCGTGANGITIGDMADG